MRRRAPTDSPRSRWEADTLLGRLLLVAYFLETGLVLLIGPWSALWERNYFTGRVPSLEPILLSGFVRGAVSGLGAVTLGGALADLGMLLARRRARRAGETGSVVETP
ncbi:MAG TPA: hypothetical protein VNI83_06995 [Vicinamibacterales bacterium]|nr:hypothetical protein [Vicinamibacterales bacterium]